MVKNTNNNNGLDPIYEIYERLLKLHGPQGWWPLNSLKTQIIGTYHPGDFSYPHNGQELFEIAVGAILTQNTAWLNVEQAINQMYQHDLLCPSSLLESDVELLKEAIRCTGYFNQKSKKLLHFASFFQQLDGKVPTREQLLDLWGIGPETADCILLYGYKVPSFVVDTYTRRVFTSLGYLNESMTYEQIRAFFQKNVPSSFEIYQEYHALIVAHAKCYYGKKSGGEKDPLLR